MQIVVAHSGPGFSNPERAFDPFTPIQTSTEAAGLGLSLCATILRDHNGRAWPSTRPPWRSYHPRTPRRGCQIKFAKTIAAFDHHPKLKNGAPSIER